MTPFLDQESGPEAAVDGGREGQAQLQQKASVWMTSPYHVRMRAKTPSQFPTELASLSEKLEDMGERLELVRKGRGLFKLMQDREMEKVKLAHTELIFDDAFSPTAAV